MFFIQFPNCKSLWIKASAKWLNVNKCIWQPLTITIIIICLVTSLLYIYIYIYTYIYQYCSNTPAVVFLCWQLIHVLHYEYWNASMSGKQSCLCRRKDSFFSDDWSLYNHAVKLHGHWFMQWIKNEPMARKPARRGGAIWLCKWAIAIGSQINSPSVTTIFPSLIYGTALPLTLPLCHPWIPATPNQGWMPTFPYPL